MYLIIHMSGPKEDRTRKYFTEAEFDKMMSYLSSRSKYYTFRQKENLGNYVKNWEEAIYLIRFKDITPKQAKYVRKQINGRQVKVQEALIPLLKKYFDQP